MDLRTIFGIKYPIIQGGMANIATGAFAAAISNAGGLGLIGSGGWTPEQLQQEIQIAKNATDKPFGVNVMLMNPHVDAIADLLVEEGIKIITTGAGVPGKYIPRWKESGAKVFPVVPSVGLARRVASQDADGVIVEGTEAGGHIGELTTMALVPQVAAAVDIPVVAAGGIASGRQMLAALALGACGIQIGTTLLRAEECPIHENYKQAVIKAKDTDTIVTGRIAGVPVRILKNKMAQEYVKQERAGATVEELEHFTLGSLRKAVFDGDTVAGSLMAGQVAGMVKELQPAEQILRELFEDCQKAFAEMQQHPVLAK